MASRQIVEHHDLLASRVKQIRDYTADISRAAGYQYGHVILLCATLD